MNKTFLILFLSCLYLGSMAQVELVVQHPDKDKFYLFVDGLRENEDPRSRVKVKKLQDGPHHIKVIFEKPQGSTPQLKVNLEAGYAYEFEIKRYANGTRKWLALNEISKKELPPKVVKKTLSDTLPVQELKVASDKSDSLFNAHLPIPKISEPSDSANRVNIMQDSVALPPGKMEFQCQNPVRPLTFDTILEELQSAPKDEMRLERALSYSEKHCLSAIQIMEILQLFDQESLKIDYATHAYRFCFDPMNYQFVEDSFKYEASARELHNRIYSEQEKSKR
ncbi:DUF4476 domain-containing protein [bacterium SCSIO 12741]|nr:DUF4476 domain-containing protein [bacterium SCSIO 12741]